MNTITTQELESILTNPNTSLEILALGGWELESNQGGTYFRHRETQAVRAIPFWCTQMVQNASNHAEDYTRAKMRHALGLE